MFLFLFIQQVPQNFTPPAPITAPIMAPPGSDPQLPSSGAPQPGMQGAQVSYSGVQQQVSPPMNPAMPKTSMEGGGAPGAPTGDAIQVRREVQRNMETVEKS